MILKKYYFLVILFLFSCKKTDLKTENKEATNTVESIGKEFKQVALECSSNDYMVDNCSYKDFKFKIDYDVIPNGINFSLGKKKYYHNLNFSFEGIGNSALLFENDNRKIFILELEYEYNKKLLVFKIENNSIFYLKDIDYEIASDQNVSVNYKLNEINDKLDIYLQNQNIKKYFELNYKNQIQVKEVNVSSVEKLKTITSNLNGTWAVICQNELTELDINDSVGFLSLYDFNSIYINLKVEKSSKENEYILKYESTSSQKKFYDDKLSILDEDIDKDKVIGKLFIKKDGNAELNWIGLFNLKKNRLEFVGNDFLLIKENGGKQPIALEKCN